MKSSEFVEATGYGRWKIDRAVKNFRETGGTKLSRKMTTLLPRQRQSNWTKFAAEFVPDLEYLRRKMTKQLEISELESVLWLSNYYKLNCCYFLQQSDKAETARKISLNAMSVFADRNFFLLSNSTTAKIIANCSRKHRNRQLRNSHKVASRPLSWCVRTSEQLERRRWSSLT